MKHLALLAVFVLSLSLHVHAQRSKTELIEMLTTQRVNLSPDQQNKVQAMSNNDKYKQTYLVRIGNVASVQKNGMLKMKIPGQPRTYIAKVKSVEAMSEEEYTWVGEIEGDLGTVILIGKEGRVFGQINVNDDVYVIHDLGNQMNLMVELDQSKFTASDCDAVDKDGEFIAKEKNEKIQEVVSAGIPGGVRILVLYTTAAQNAVPNINDLVFLCVQQMNTALNNSNVSNFDVFLAGVQHLNLNETPDIRTDVENLNNSSVAQSYRNSHEADIVLLLVDGNYSNAYGTVSVIGPDESHAYGLVDIDAATSRYTFVHEAAHLFGARHDWDYDSTPGYAHGHSYTTGALWWRKTHKTVLTVDPEGAYRILYYSNPNVEYSNKPTGKADRDNARQISGEALTVSQFRDYDPPVSVNISGPAFGNNSGTYTWTATAVNGTVPVTFVWDYSLDGFNYSYFGNGPAITAQLPLGQDLYLRVTATDADGTQDVAWHTTYNNDTGPCIHCGQLVAQNDGDQDNPGVQFDGSAMKGATITKSKYVPLYPNPAQDVINVSVSIEHVSSYAVFEVYDLTGKLVLSEKHGNIPSGLHTFKLDISGLRPGQYFVRLRTNEFVETRKLMVLKN